MSGLVGRNAVDDWDDAQGTFRIDAVVGVRLAFVGRKHLASVRGERDHVGQGTGDHTFHKTSILSLEKVDPSRLLLVGVFDRNGDQAV